VQAVPTCHARGMAAPEIPLATAADVRVSLIWHPDEDGALHGSVTVHNISDRAVRVGGKPMIRPLGEDARPLETEHLVTAELRMPPHVDIPPGGRATASVSWAGWPGPAASGSALVSWNGGETVVQIDGPAQPPRTEEPWNLSSSWFDLVS
jgi:hypothetical protein